MPPINTDAGRRRLLIIGGSGFISGALAKAAVKAGYEVTAITRGLRRVPLGVRAIAVNRSDRTGFARIFQDQLHPWDLVVDTICYHPDDALQDIAVFTGKAHRFVYLSTDFVYDPSHRKIPQDEQNAVYATANYGGLKRAAEDALQRTDWDKLPWTILRLCHVYGPGSELGCLPLHGRDPELLSKLDRGIPVRLVAGGKFRQQPLLVDDLVQTILGITENPRAVGCTINVAGPETVESHIYYRLIAKIIGCRISIEDQPIEEFLASYPGEAPFCCDRIADLSMLRASGLFVPSTKLETGLRQHVASMIQARA